MFCINLQKREENGSTYNILFSFPCAAKLRASMGMHKDQNYRKRFMTPHEISDRDKGAKMLII